MEVGRCAQEVHKPGIFSRLANTSHLSASVYSVYDIFFLSDFMCLLSEEIAASGCFCLQSTDTF